MFNLGDITNENSREHNEKWPFITDHLYRILIIRGSGSGKTNALLNLIKERGSDSLIDKIYLYAKDLNEPKYEFLIKKWKDTGAKHKRELQHIAIDNSADSDYREFVKIYRECIKEPSSFLATDITLPANDPPRLTKKSFHTYKMTIAHQIKILDRKIKQNEGQYDLDRKSARISALPSGNKYEYLTGEYLD